MLRFMPAVFLASFVAAAAAPNWSQPKTITLFHPGQTSMEWLLAPADHKGAAPVRGGMACQSCHTGQERAMGATTMKKYEAAPIPAKPPAITATVQFARDAQNLYVRFQFSDAGQPDAKMAQSAARVAMMLDSAPETARAGCWAACHADSATMPRAKGSSRTMYLGKTRAGPEYWEAAISPTGTATAANGVIFDKRQATKTAVTAQASRNGANWTVVLSRRLGAGSVVLSPSRKYTVAFAIDAGHTAGRFHYVSLQRSLVLDQGSADFVAK